MTAPLPWIEETHDLGPGGRRVERRASEAECRAVAEALGILACKSLTFNYSIRPRSEGRCRLEGRVAAEFAQACVVSLEPVPEKIVEDVAIDFWPADLLADREAGGGDRAILTSDEPEPLGPHGRIETGRLAFEIVSAGLDPYPRKEGAAFQWSEGTEDGDAEHRDNPFAALKSLKLGEPKE